MTSNSSGRILLLAVLLLAAMRPVYAGTTAEAKTGNLDIKSTAVGTRVYVDDEYRGDANIFIENVPVGAHAVTCRQGSRRLSGSFILKENETLRLEARFDDEKIVDLSRDERAESEQKKQERARREQEEQEKARRAESDQRKQRKQEQAASRTVHRDIFQASFKYSPTGALTVVAKPNSQATRAFSEKKSQAGEYYRIKGGTLMCKKLPCTAEWSATFTYVDEKGGEESFKIVWSETTFEYMTLEGLSKRLLEWCVNKDCLKFQSPDPDGRSPKPQIDRYGLTWTESSIVIRRTD